MWYFFFQKQYKNSFFLYNFLFCLLIQINEIFLFFVFINTIQSPKEQTKMQAFQWEQKDDSTPLWVHMIAGSCAGITQHISMLPLDNIKTHCQAGSQFKLTQIMKNIYETGGLKNFYSGSSILAIGCIPAHAIYFSIYQKSKQFLNCQHQDYNYRFAFVGILSSLFHDSIMTPTQVIKQRLQLYRTQTKWISTRQLMRLMYKSQGVLSFYRSFGINYVMNVPFSSMIVMMNEKLKQFFNVKENNHHLSYYVCGGIAGGLASIPTTPFDVIKTKLNTQACLNHPCEKRSVCQKMTKKTQKFTTNNGLSKGCGSGYGSGIFSNQPASQMQFTTTNNAEIRYHNILDTTAKIFKQQGMMGFFSGLRMRIAIQSFSSAIAWGTYQVDNLPFNGIEKLIKPPNKFVLQNLQKHFSTAWNQRKSTFCS